MSSCLGLYVEENLIKYAKISKDNDIIKIENHGVKFYDSNLDETIKHIIDETYSYKIPISINLSGEKYAYTEIFGMLSESDQKKTIKTEFEYFCNETSKNRLTLDYRTIISTTSKDKDKKKVLYVYAEKGNIAERLALLDSYKLANLYPVSLAIPDLVSTFDEDSIIINLENKTELTTIIDGKPSRVDVIDEGMGDILKKIAEKENSISKAYEICKNTTLYTASSQNLQTENNEYLELIVPSIYRIVEEIKKVIEKNDIEFKKIYLTGTGTIINNIDLYFQENFISSKCEILTPYFIDRTSLKLNIRSYIETNSAICLAMQAIYKSDKKINFATQSETLDKIKNILKSDVSFTRSKSTSKKSINNIKINIKDINCIRFAYSSLIIFVIYIIITTLIAGKINKKINLTDQVIEDTKEKTAKIASTTTLVNSRANNYETILEQLKEADERATESYLSKNAVPNLLNEIMFAVPKEVQIVSIDNSNEKHVVIQAQAEQYQYLGYFKSELQNKAILVNVTSTSGTRTSDMIQVTIEGDLPY